MRKPWNSTFRYWLATALILFMLAALWFVRELIGPLVIGALIAFVLNPSVNMLHRSTRLSKSTVVTLGLLITLALLIGLGAILSPALVTESQVLSTDFQEILSDVQVFVAEPLIFLGRQIDLQRVLPDFSNLVTEGIATIPENAFHLLEATSRNLIWALVILATTYYLLRDWEHLRDWVFNQVPKAEQPDMRRLYKQLKGIWLGYFRGNLLLMLIVGVVFTIAWLAIGLPGAVILGVIAGLLTIIPDLGPAIAAVLAMVVALVEGSNFLPLTNLVFALLVLGVYLVLINIKSIWIRPRIFGRSVHMHAGVVFVAIMAAVILQGVLGAIVVIPLLASVGVLFRYAYRRLTDQDPFD
ncbi:MAG: AI-2E family transporter [Chloroflexi bacterium]|nr:AI-2E family transporter [Chloroflexota bacterium]